MKQVLFAIIIAAIAFTVGHLLNASNQFAGLVAGAGAVIFLFLCSQTNTKTRDLLINAVYILTMVFGLWAALFFFGYKF